MKYSDIYLQPRYSFLKTRADADVSVKLGDNSFKLPIIPANMRAVISQKKSDWLSENGYFYIMHRFDICPIKFSESFKEKRVTSISLGVNAIDKDVVALLSAQAHKVEYITVDIAHGHSILMKNMIEHIKSNLPETFIIAGNVATKKAVEDLADWGADCIKVGIGQGHVCTTKDKTGFTRPMFSSLLECCKDKSVPIIADGGIKSNGDIAKALVAGADMVMAGSLFSQCSDSPTKSVISDGRVYKQYFGSASEYNKKEKKHIEGVMREVPSNNMTYEEKLEEIKQDLQSAVSYAGGSDLSAFQNVKWGT